jgi:hypothetical protein
MPVCYKILFGIEQIVQIKNFFVSPTEMEQSKKRKKFGAAGNVKKTLMLLFQHTWGLGQML